jgi:predicted nucleic acid-binding protein
MLVDSSVWIGYLRGDDHIEVQYLTSALERGEPVWLAPPILQEVLQGADNPDRFKRWDRVLGELPMIIAPDGREAARNAAHLYAIHAILGGIPLLHRDRDFGLISSVEPRLAIVVPTKETRPTRLP